MSSAATNGRGDYTDEEALTFFATLSMAKLRQYQDLTRQQIKIAHDKRIDRAMTELQRYDGLLIQAIHTKAFGG